MEELKKKILELEKKILKVTNLIGWIIEDNEVLDKQDIIDELDELLEELEK